MDSPAERIDAITAAIARDDGKQLASLLVADAELVRRQVARDQLLTSGIFHWIYVGDTPLHIASAGHRVRLAELLLAAGSDANAASNRRRSTPLHYAADGFVTGQAWDPVRQVATLELLLKAGARINSQDATGATALHRATRTRCALAVRCLLNAGANPLLRNASGSAAFHLAVQTTGRGGSGEPVAKDAQARIIQEFLSHGVRPDLKDGKGHTVVECARSDWVRALLRQAAG
jgi:hypothetical protein